MGLNHKIAGLKKRIASTNFSLNTYIENRGSSQAEWRQQRRAHLTKHGNVNKKISEKDWLNYKLVWGDNKSYNRPVIHHDEIPQRNARYEIIFMPVSLELMLAVPHKVDMTLSPIGIKLYDNITKARKRCYNINSVILKQYNQERAEIEKKLNTFQQ